MKIFDWKRRGDTATIETENNLESVVFTLDNLTHAPGSRHRKNRVGRGIAAGQGHQCGFGMRGQNSRKGPGKTAGFEGGQTPLYRRLPKFPGQPMGPGHQKMEYNIIKLNELNGVATGETCNCTWMDLFFTCIAHFFSFSDSLFCFLFFFFFLLPS